MNFLYLKSLHIVFVVSWFAALFYIVRLFIYTAEAQSKDDLTKSILTTQLTLMQRKLWYIIGWPAMIGTHVFGFWMLFSNLGYYLAQPWMWLKLVLIVLLTLYHLVCQTILTKQRKGIFTLGSFKLRLFNELATVFFGGHCFFGGYKIYSRFTLGCIGLVGFCVCAYFGSEGL